MKLSIALGAWGSAAILAFADGHDRLSVHDESAEWTVLVNHLLGAGSPRRE